jgi:hypothetical protein
MEKLVTHILETKKDGTKIVKNFFFNDDKVNHLAQAHSYFTSEEKKRAKAHYKLGKKVNAI